jgi:hypothetical protein
MAGKLSPDTSFGLVHVGKCGGATVEEALRDRNFIFDHYHLRRPVYKEEQCYVILVRDPIARIVSAFNWRYYWLSEEIIRQGDAKDPLAQMKHRFELDFLSQFENVNAFAEQLVRPGKFDVSPISTMMSLVGHVMQGFVWYLGDLLESMQPHQLAGVITTERLADDVEALFGFRPDKERNRYYPSRESFLSPRGRANLAREFEAEYRMLHRLEALANQAGVRMSMTYDPATGAAPRPLEQ